MSGAYEQDQKGTRYSSDKRPEIRYDISNTDDDANKKCERHPYDIQPYKCNTSYDDGIKDLTADKTAEHRMYKPELVNDVVGDPDREYPINDLLKLRAQPLFHIKKIHHDDDPQEKVLEEYDHIHKPGVDTGDKPLYILDRAGRLCPGDEPVHDLRIITHDGALQIRIGCKEILDPM